MTMTQRAKTAINRRGLSRPVRLTVDEGLLHRTSTLLDYGCGRGVDVRLLCADGFEAWGWDPSHRPDGKLDPADVVNLGYVVNVIEDEKERAVALRSAWALTTKLLVVSARLSAEEGQLATGTPFRDGCLTGRGTFQKFFDQGELRAWIDATLGTQCVAAAPGVFYVFRDDAAEQSFLASRQRRRAAAPRPRLSDVLFEEHQPMLASLMDFFAQRGRLPAEMEIDQAEALVATFGSLKRAFSVIRRVTGAEKWAAIERERKNDLLVYLALTRFGKRPKSADLPDDLRRDVRALTGSYVQACREADELLFSAGDMKLVKAACRTSTVGKRLPTALYVHLSALTHLPTILRTYEGCARSYVGAVDGANLIKIHFDEPKISYLSYPDFETEGHPALTGSLLVPLRGNQQLKYRDFSKSENPPILHRKELFVHSEHAMHDEFAALTQAEESAGLFGQSSKIGLRKGWQEVLEASGCTVAGHALTRNQG